MEGKILSTVGGVYVVYSDGLTYNVFPKGNLRFKNKKLYIGDNVEINDSFVITDVKERKNELIRPKSANIDQLLIVMSVKEPDLSYELIYKFLTYANMNEIPSLVALTKMDMIDDLTEINELKNDLKKIGTDLFLLSKDETSELNRLKETLNHKTTIIMGQTGVGKSSLINLIDPSYNRKVGEYSLALGRGKHKTKEVILLPYQDGFIGDTPGFSSLELDLYKEDLAQYFPGYEDLYLECYFSNCLHQNEKDCNIKKHIESGLLSLKAYQTYLKLLSELPYRKERYK